MNRFIKSRGWIALTASLFAVEAFAERLVTLGGDVTEIVFALGVGDSVVAVDSSSIYPPATRLLPQVGYLRALSAEGVLSLRPERIIANDDLGPAAIKRQLQGSGVALHLVPSQPSPQQLQRKIREVAALIGKAEAGEALAEELRDKFARLALRRDAVKDRPRVLFIMNHGGGSPMIAGRETAADTMIELAGADNAAAGFPGYKAMTPEALVAAAPDWLLITDQGLQQFGGESALLAQPGFALTPAGRSGRILSMDALLLLGFGPRSADAALNLFAQFHHHGALAQDAR